MQNITIGRYDNPEAVGGWVGWVEPADKSWILFIASDGSTKYYAAREENGGVLE
jgi:hypothetical protein